MFQIRRSKDRGQFDHGWLKTAHTFSFGDYLAPEYTRFRKLRVMNEDFIAPGKGFGTHPHHDMEILSYVLSGRLRHKDSMGNEQTIEAGEFQCMTAGSGITHSEFNPSSTQTTHLYQIWIFPDSKGLEPGYQQQRFDSADVNQKFVLVASPDSHEQSLPIHQDAKVFLSRPLPETQLQYTIASKRHLWLQVLAGSIRIGNDELHAGDGIAISEEPMLQLTAINDSQLMLFDLP